MTVMLPPTFGSLRRIPRRTPAPIRGQRVSGSPRRTSTASARRALTRTVSGVLLQPVPTVVSKSDSGASSYGPAMPSSVLPPPSRRANGALQLPHRAAISLQRSPSDTVLINTRCTPPGVAPVAYRSDHSAAELARPVAVDATTLPTSCRCSSVACRCLPPCFLFFSRIPPESSPALSVLIAQHCILPKLVVAVSRSNHFFLRVTPPLFLMLANTRFCRPRIFHFAMHSKRGSTRSHKSLPFAPFSVTCRPLYLLHGGVCWRFLSMLHRNMKYALALLAGFCVLTAWGVVSQYYILCNFAIRAYITTSPFLMLASTRFCRPRLFLIAVHSKRGNTQQSQATAVLPSQ